MGKEQSITKVHLIKKNELVNSKNWCTINSVYKDHSQDPKNSGFVDKWSLVIGHLCNQMGSQNGGHYSEVVVCSC